MSHALKAKHLALTFLLEEDNAVVTPLHHAIITDSIISLINLPVGSNDTVIRQCRKHKVINLGRALNSCIVEQKENVVLEFHFVRGIREGILSELAQCFNLQVECRPPHCNETTAVVRRITFPM